MTLWIWVASSRVGDRTRACVSRTDESIDWSIEMENVAVFPVPDCACRRASVSFRGSRWSCGGGRKRAHLSNDIAALGDGQDRTLLDR